MPHLSAGTLEDRRGRLLAWVKRSGLAGRGNNRVTIVFDGQAECFGAAVTGEVAVVFSSGESADDLIKRTVERSTAKKQWVVISDDKGIKLYVRALGACVVGVKEFALILNKQDKPVRGLEGEKRITHAQAKLINDEFEKIWNIK